MSHAMEAYMQYLGFSFCDASVAFDYESFAFFGQSLDMYLETKEFYDNEKGFKCSEFGDLDRLGQFQLELFIFGRFVGSSILRCFFWILWGALCHTLPAHPLLREGGWLKLAWGSCNHSISSRLW